MRAAFLTGLVLIASIGGITWFVMATSKDKFSGDDTYPLTANFSDAAGIRWKTRVQINGIDVGKIEEISHTRDDEGRLMAQVKIRLLDDYEVYENAQVKKAAESLLGDFRLDLNPGGPQDLCDDYTPCPEGFACRGGFCVRECEKTLDCPERMACSQNVCAYKLLSTEGKGHIRRVESVSDLDEIQSNLKNITRDVQKVTGSLRTVLGSKDGQGSLQSILENVEKSMTSIREATHVMNKTLDRNDERVDQIIKNLETFSNVMAETVNQGGDVKTTAENLASLTGRLDEIAKSINDMMESTSADEASVRKTVEELNKAMAHIAEISRKIDEGEGTLGQLINDRTISDEVESVAEEVGDLVEGITRLELEVEWRAQYEIPIFEKDQVNGPNRYLDPAVKNIIGLRIKPKPDKYYLIEIVTDPRGKSTRVIETESVNEGPVTTTETTNISFNDFKLSAQFAKRFYVLDSLFVTLRFGLIENTGGVGMNLHFLEDTLEFRVDLFDFTRFDPYTQQELYPRLRATVMFRFLEYFGVKHLSVQGGFDDPFNFDTGQPTFFIGSALRFTDEDLMMLLAVAPSP